jgi:hypothetical protein
MIPNDEGRYIAQPRKWTLGKSKEGAVEFAVEFALSQWYSDADGEWKDVATEGLSIVGYFYPITKEGKINQFQYDSLCESLGWNGTALKDLQNGDWSKTEVQLVLQHEEYKGKPQMKVKFLNPRDSNRGGMKEADPQTVMSLDQQFGALLRASARQKAPAKPSGNGETPIPEAEQERRAAYRHLIGKMDAGATKDAKDALWKGTVADYFRGRPQLQVTAQEWREFVKNDCVRPVPVSPIGEEEQFKDEDIPF